MSDLKAAKDALVASLFELSKAAQEAANATVNFYRVSSQEGNADSLNHLAVTLNTIASTVSSDGIFAPLPSALDSVAAVARAAGTGTGANSAKKGPATAEEKKRKKAEKDPNAPKKPLTIFFAFSFHTREVIRDERRKKGLPALSAIEMNDVIKERWNSITPEEKSKWQKKYANELKEYQKVKEAYKAGLTTTEVKPPVAAPESSSSDDSSAEEEKLAPIHQETPKKSKDSKKRKSEKSERKSEKKSKNKELNNK
ncbi:uncharacterized protein PRCAT00000463001 [Priceomyces carsonii]|uniref:uncharacterized protein n=1 Tax=Priceomyces carsonii TaxID=28549 RepID=UPI002ED80E0E|nr:unnamed protein product [Priceomyces carsonii]